MGAVFEARGDFSGTIVVEITPMSVSDFLNQGLTPVPQVIADGNLHYATPGNDHNYFTNFVNVFWYCRGHVYTHGPMI